MDVLDKATLCVKLARRLKCEDAERSAIMLMELPTASIVDMTSRWDKSLLCVKIARKVNAADVDGKACELMSLSEETLTSLDNAID